MRIYLYVSYALLLAGCVNYAGTHSTSIPLDNTALALKHTYSLPAKPLVSTQNNWWARFKDPQLSLLIATALADSPDMQVAEARISKAQRVTDGAESTLWPSLNLSGNVQREYFSKYGLVPPPFNGRTFNIGEVGFNFNYELDFWGKNRETLAAKITEACATQQELAQAQLVISTSVAAVYFQLQSDIAKLRIANEILHQKSQILAIINDRAHHGVDSDIPVKTAQADLDAAKLIVEQYAQAENIARHQLAFLLGKNPFTTTITVKKFSYHKHVINLPANLPANLLARRPDIVASRLRTESAAHEVNVAKARFFPNINLNGLFSYQTVVFGQLFNPKSQNNAVSGAFDLPIFDAGARRANLGVRYAEYDLAVGLYNQSIIMALRETADQLSMLSTLKKQLDAQSNALQVISREYQLINSRYHHGINDYISVLAARDLLLQQQLSQIDYQARHLTASIAMIKVLGGDFPGSGGIL